MNLIHYGFDPENQSEQAGGIPARITAVHRDRYALVCEHGEGYGRLKAKIYYADGNMPFPTTGDFIRIEYNPSGDSRIIATLPRKTFFSRRNPTPGQGEQAVAANFDIVFIMQSLNQDFNARRLERYLTSAWQSGAVPVIVLTKADLTEDYQSHVRAAGKVAGSVDIIVISTQTGYGLEALYEYLKPGTTAVFLGSSGVGKSSLVNLLAGGERMAVKEIREEDSRGRHTTTHRQLCMLKNGAMIIDTPGMRELGMWDVTSGLGEAFEDVKQYLGQCKFNDCRHRSEPGCAVKRAIETGELSLKRWESYTSLENEARYSEDKVTYMKNKKDKQKGIAQHIRRMEKTDYRHAPCQETFTCLVCGEPTVPDGAGSGHRNHCPRCLSSVHVDNEPGDRASLCKSIMDPIGVWVRKNGEWAIIHRCRSCGILHSNRVAADDNPALLMSIAVKPLAAPPFPLDKIGSDSL